MISFWSVCTHNKNVSIAINPIGVKAVGSTPRSDWIIGVVEKLFRVIITVWSSPDLSFMYRKASAPEPPILFSEMSRVCKFLSFGRAIEMAYEHESPITIKQKFR